MQTLKKQRGITLIALVITIAIMLILAVVTISVSLKGGLFSTANEATSQMQIEIEKEQLLTAALGALGRNGKIIFNDLDSNLPDGFIKISEGKYKSTTGNTYQVTEDADIILLDENGEEEEEPETPVVPPATPTIELNPETITGEIESGTAEEVGTITATVTNVAGDLTWSITPTDSGLELVDTDNENIKKVTACKAVENATITVSYGSVSDTCSVTITEIETIEQPSNSNLNETDTGLASASIWTNGEGTEDNPYLIESKANLAYLAKQVNLGNKYTNVYFRLDTYLVLGEDEELWIPIGNTSDRYFDGTFDGNGNVINYIEITKGYNYRGLFGFAGTNSSIKNLTLNNVYASDDSNGDFVGGIVGYNRGTIDNCYISDTANLNGNNYVGGIAGYNSGNIKNCVVNATAELDGNNYVGGITGYNNGNIEECSVNNCTISGIQYIGGVTGYNSGDIKMPTANSCTVSGTEYVGGIAGYNDGNIEEARAENCTISGTEYIGGITGYNNQSILKADAIFCSISGSENTDGIAGYNNGTCTECINEGNILDSNGELDHAGGAE